MECRISVQADDNDIVLSLEASGFCVLNEPKYAAVDLAR